MCSGSIKGKALPVLAHVLGAICRGWMKNVYMKIAKCNSQCAIVPTYPNNLFCFRPHHIERD